MTTVPMTTSAVRSWTDILLGTEVPLAVRDWGGNGHDILLLHGAGRTAVDWEPMAAALPGFRVVAMDLRCHGLSGDGPWTWPALLDDIQFVIDHLELDRPAVVGHSLGGIVASLWAAENPECPAAINIDGHWPRSPALYDGIEPEVTRQRLAVLEALSDYGAPAPTPESQLEERVAAQTAAAAAAGLDPGMAGRALRRSLSISDGFVATRPSAGVATALVRAVQSTDLLSVWAATKCPLLVISCSQVDPPPEGAPEWLPEMLLAYRRGLTRALREIAQSQPLVTVQLFDGDHGLIWNRPAAVAELVATFFTAELSS